VPPRAARPRSAAAEPPPVHKFILELATNRQIIAEWRNRRRIVPVTEKQPSKTQNPPVKAGRCPGKAGEDHDVAITTFPEISIHGKRIFCARRSFAWTNGPAFRR
jgi:hypothetical protein